MTHSRRNIDYFINSASGLLALAVAAVLFAHPWGTGPGAVPGIVPLEGDDTVKMQVLVRHDVPDPGKPLVKEEVLVEGLKSPDGLTMDPYNGALYLTEEDAARIIRVDVDGEKKVIADLSTPVFEDENGLLVTAPGLRGPEGIAFSPREGRLYVVEDVPNGRLIAFDLPDYHDNIGHLKGVVVKFPQPAPGYAWESVAVGPNGELLLAGSNFEAFLDRTRLADIFSGAIVYRDSGGQWWMPVYRLLDSFSGACFGPEGLNAFFTSELMGYAGCFDLRTHYVRTWYSDAAIPSAEGVAALPDGTAVVAAEGGKLIRVDPHDCFHAELHDFGEPIESIIWDGARSRLLVTADGSGRILALNDVYFNASQKVQGPLVFEENKYEMEPVEVCPDYLVGLLKMSGYDPTEGLAKEAFPDLVRNLSMFAIDAETVLMPSSDPIDDPLKRVQFVIMSPRMFGVDLSALTGPVNGFVAVHASGAMDRTAMFPRNLMHVDLFDGQFTLFDSRKIPLPYPYTYRFTQEGTAAVSFMGFGETLDFHIIVNMRDPSQAYMVVLHPDRTYQQYQLKLPEGKTIHHWIVGIEAEEVGTWTRLEFGNENVIRVR